MKFERSPKTLDWTRIEILLNAQVWDSWDSPGVRDVKINFRLVYGEYRNDDTAEAMWMWAVKGKARILGIYRKSSVVFYAPPAPREHYGVKIKPVAWYAEISSADDFDGYGPYRKNMFDDDLPLDKLVQKMGSKAVNFVETAKKAADGASELPRLAGPLLPLNECPFHIQALEWERFGKHAKSLPTYLPAR